MAYSLVSSVQGRVGVGSFTINGGDTNAINTSTAALIVAGNCYFGNNGGPNGPTTVTDSKSNTWVYGTRSEHDYGSGNVFGCQLAWTLNNPTVGSGHTFNFARNNGNLNCFVAAFTGNSAGDVFDAQVVNQNNVGGVTSLQSGSLTPAKNNEL